MHILKEYRYAETVDMSVNSIKAMPGDIFYNMSFLKKVHLHHNKIASLNATLFTVGSSSIEFIDLSYNRLTEINPGELNQFAAVPLTQQMHVQYAY